jgi:hypothetical protein
MEAASASLGHAVETAPAALSPALTLADLFDAGKLYDPRQPYETSGISPDGDAECDGLTGAHNFLAAGALRVLCHRDAATPAALELLELAGHVVAAEPVVYASRAEYDAILAAARPGEVVYKHVHPPSEAPPETYAVPRDLLVRLTNKALLHEFVEPAHLARRRTVATAELAAAVSAGDLPVVAKAACDESLGGGDGVRICRAPADVAAAARDFAAAPEVVVEEYLPILSNWCVNFGIVPGEPARYVGAAEQIVSPEGAYQGNRIGRTPPEEVVRAAQSTAHRTREAGYRGLAGFDVVETIDGRAIVLDLNCRLNGCTVALLLQDAIHEWSGTATMVAASWTTALDDSRLLATLLELVDRRRLVPTGSFLPADATRTVWGVALGESLADALAGVVHVQEALA